MKIGPYQFSNNLALAPMAGVTDKPFRLLCLRLGAAMAAGEMISADPRLMQTVKSRRRMDHSGEPEPRIVQIAGGDPQMMAAAARFNAERGAGIIDINMGCPAKKVCNKAAGSALLRDEDHVRRILDATVAAVDVPVTLKIRTGWSPEEKNCVRIAEIAEQCGVQAIAIHGRTRACKFGGHAEYQSIAEVKRAISIPVIANGDIDSAQRAREVLQQTGADGLMIGRAAQGRPWVFREIAACLSTPDKNDQNAAPAVAELRDIMLAHLEELYRFYGEQTGVRVARKHLGWYCRNRTDAGQYRNAVVRVDSAAQQVNLTRQYFERATDDAVAA
ncbi:MAG: tRNA dihydrouridine synthase DusB [Gammaproteobacteria bacterium]|nr:tRNA dihydrouridine synthase DusB [Gammaproteobacteria bacterium]NNF61423.1 tRNA dihydrouridine synthase DusB [Gammaproteobacteria bacterium]NNM20995.1 tRNA dihydrouridine synthase DusB [Gammaproteobacteria bacterium]